MLITKNHPQESERPSILTSLENDCPVAVTPVQPNLACATSRRLWPKDETGAPIPLLAAQLHHLDGNCAFVLMPRHQNGGGSATRQIGTFRIADLKLAPKDVKVSPVTTEEITEFVKIRRGSATFQKKLVVVPASAFTRPEAPIRVNLETALSA